MQSIQECAWAKVLDAAQAKVGVSRFNLWLRHTVLKQKDSSTWMVGAPNIFAVEWLKRHYSDVITDCVQKITGFRGNLVFVVDQDAAEMFRRHQEENPQDAAGGASGQDEPAPAPAKRRALPAGLNGDFRFDNFVVGPCNRLAFGAVRSVHEEPGAQYNPLFVYGSSGLGKTHLLQAVAFEFSKARPSADVLYTTGENFVNEYVSAVKRGKLDDFRARFRKIDFLVVDDVHVLSGKGRTQEEFLHTFNACFSHGRQIVMASDSHPDAIAELRKELKGRFASGLMARLDPPTYLTRLAILREKARALPVTVPDELLSYVANNVKSNVRHLEGALKTLSGMATLLNEPLTVETAAALLRQNHDVKENVVTLGDIEDAVVAGFGITSQELHSRSRRRDLVLPRRLGMMLARKLTRHSFEEIGQYFGKRDHVTVITGIREIEKTIKSSPEVAGKARAIEDAILHP